MSSNTPIIQPRNAGQLALSAPRYSRMVRCAPRPYFLLFGSPLRLRKRPRAFWTTNRPKPRSDGSCAGGAGDEGGGDCVSGFVTFGNLSAQAAAIKAPGSTGGRQYRDGTPP